MVNKIPKLLVIAVAFALSVFATNLAPAHKAQASSNAFPVTRQEVIDQFQVEHDPNDGCFDVTKDTSGWEIHGTWFKVYSLGSTAMQLKIDMNPGHYNKDGKDGLVAALNSNPVPNGAGGERYFVPAGQTVFVFSTGVCGVGMTIYPGAIGSSPTTSSYTPPTYVAPPALPFTPPATGSGDCVMTAQEAAQHTGLPYDPSYFHQQDGPNGQKYNGPSVSVHSDLPLYEVLTPGYPAQPGLPYGQYETTIVATVYKICSPGNAK